jgi:hypothetical protein
MVHTLIEASEAGLSTGFIAAFRSPICLSPARPPFIEALLGGTA